MLNTVRKWIERHKLVGRGDVILAACSGGPDSVALVHLLAGLRQEYGFSLAAAHVNHLLRGAESDADAVFVADFCGRLGLPLYQGSVDVRAFMSETGRSLEDAARVLRYRFLRETARGLGGAKIATGHHRDDQAETVLLNLFRGAGGAGLAGIHPAANGVIRPLLSVSRAGIEAYCRDNKLGFRTDSTNLETDYQRNYLRRELMPVLARRFNANIAATLCRTGELVGDEHDFVSLQAAAAAETAISGGRDRVAIVCAELAGLHIALRRELIRLAVEKKRGSLKGISFGHVEKILEMVICGDTGKVIEMPGFIARREYALVALEDAGSPPGPDPDRAAQAVIKVPGETRLPSLGLTVRARVSKEPVVAKGPETAVLDLGKITLPLYVRIRREGDRFRPAGLGGTKKLKEFFIDAKVPRRERDRIPLFCDRQGICWVGGYRLDERAAPSGATREYLQLIMTRED